MRPTEQEPRKDEELIAHLKSVLQKHEEPYQAGAWERFNERQPARKRTVLWVWRASGVAALLAICIGAFLVMRHDMGADTASGLAKSKALTKETDSPVPANNDNGADMAATDVSSTLSSSASHENRRLAVYREAAAIASHAVQTDFSPVQPDMIAADENPVVSAGKDGLTGASVIAQTSENIKDAVNAGATVAENRKPESKAGKGAFNKNIKKWELGLMLAPSVGNNSRDLNIGYGLSMSYNFSNKLSLSSGLAYNKMNAVKNLPTNIGASSVLLGNSKSLEVISEQVTGIDIPLELRYHLNRNVYANLGISGFAVINQRRDNTFVQEVVIRKVPNTSASNGDSPTGGGNSGDGQDAAYGPQGQFANTYIVSQRTTEQAAASSMEDIRFMGFYNFSIGYTQKVYKNNTLSIEPFFKMPIKEVTKDNLRMMGAGVRLKVGF